MQLMCVVKIASENKRERKAYSGMSRDGYISLMGTNVLILKRKTVPQFEDYNKISLLLFIQFW